MSDHLDQRALGITAQTGWAACVIVRGTLREPEVLKSELIQILQGPERFCFHQAAEMALPAAEAFIAQTRRKAIANAKRTLLPLLAEGVIKCAIVAKEGSSGNLQDVLMSHPRIHSAEAHFYRDLLREISTVPVRVISPSSLDVAKVGRLAAPPWGRDQKLAAVAAWSVLME